MGVRDSSTGAWLFRPWIGFYTFQPTDITFNWVAGNHQAFAGDFDADGASDIALRNPDTGYIHLANGTGVFQFTHAENYQGPTGSQFQVTAFR